MYSKFVIIAWNKLFALTLFPEIIQRPSFFGKFLLRSFPFPRWWSSHGFGAARRRLFSGSGGDFLYCWLVQTFVYVSIEDQVVCSHLATTYRTGGCGALYKQRRTTREISHSATSWVGEWCNNHYQSNCKCLHPNLHNWYSLNVVIGCHLPSFCEVWSHYMLVRLKNFASITCGTTSLLLVSSSKLEAATSWWFDDKGCCKNPFSVSCRPFPLPFRREEILTPVK